MRSFIFTWILVATVAPAPARAREQTHEQREERTTRRRSLRGMFRTLQRKVQLHVGKAVRAYRLHRFQGKLERAAPKLRAHVHSARARTSEALTDALGKSGIHVKSAHVGSHIDLATRTRTIHRDGQKPSWLSTTTLRWTHEGLQMQHERADTGTLDALSQALEKSGVELHGNLQVSGALEKTMLSDGHGRLNERGRRALSRDAQLMKHALKTIEGLPAAP